MAAVEPIVEQQAARILEQLRTIDTADVVHVHAIDPARVIRPTGLTAIVPQHLQVLLLQAEVELPEEEAAHGYEEWWQHWSVQLYVRPSESDTTAVDTWINRFAADVRTALVDRESEWRVDGHLEYRLEGPLPFPENTGFDGAVMDLAVLLRTRRGNPYEI